MTRGHCPDDLATEVYRRTMAGMMKRFGPSRHRATVHDAVGEVFAKWLSTAEDKTQRPSGHHAHWLVKTATAFILGTSLHTGGKHIRPIASWADGNSDDATADVNQSAAKHEAILRTFYGTVDPPDYEGNLIALLDDVRADRVTEEDDWTVALSALLRRGWTRAHVADITGVSGACARAWAAGKMRPNPHRQALILGAAIQRSDPPHRPDARRLPHKINRIDSPATATRTP